MGKFQVNWRVGASDGAWRSVSFFFLHGSLMFSFDNG